MFSLKLTLLTCLCISKVIYGLKSLTVVLDSTRSMREEFDVIRTNIASAISENNRDINEYILVNFNERHAPESTVLQSARDFVYAINRIYLTGQSTECPENSLTAIERALELSKPQSNIFVFTDAYSKDAYKISSISNLCKNTRSQVVIFLTGYCLEPSSVTEQVYHDVARACSGAVFKLDTYELRKIFTFMKELVKVEWTDMVTYEAFTNYKQFSFSVDSFTKTYLLAVSGQNASVVMSPTNNSSSTIENILATRHAQVVRLSDASPGEYTVTIRSEGPIEAVLYKKYQLPLRIGFSTERPRSILETSSRPLPGGESYVLFEVTDNIKLDSVSIQMFNEQEKKTLQLEQTTNRDLYLARTFIESDKSFRIWITAHNEYSFDAFEGSTEILIPQQTVLDTMWTMPKVEIVDQSPVTAEFGTKAMLACKSLGYPRPRMWWENAEGNTVPATEAILLEMPSLFISKVEIENVTTNLIMYCKSQNAKGEDSQRIDIYVHRPYVFNVVQTPEDQTIEYGSDGKIYCEISAYPEAETKWYLNDTLITPSENIAINEEEHALVISNMQIENVGEYKCEVRNEQNSKDFKASITISGIEAPSLEVENSNVILKIGDTKEMECRVMKGKPVPITTWKFKSLDGYDFDVLPENAVVEDDRLKIETAGSKHNGVFRCYAENVLGSSYVDIMVTVQQPPEIADKETRTISINENEDVELLCDVRSAPASEVRWELLRDNVYVQLDERHRTDEHHTLRFTAQWRDSGNYICVADNGIGRAEKTVIVNVLVKPYIDVPVSETMTVRAGSNVNLMCNVLFGNPMPTTSWIFTAKDSHTRILKRSKSSSILYLNNVSFADEGSYMCLAENNIGIDSIHVTVKVQ